MNPNEQKLLSECEVQTFRSSGKGGQHVNTTDSAVRLTHRPTGIVVRASQERSQYLNKRIALAKLSRKLQEAKKVKKKRVPTKPTKSSQEKRLKEKKRRSDIKKMRRSIED